MVDCRIVLHFEVEFHKTKKPPWSRPLAVERDMIQRRDSWSVRMVSRCLRGIDVAVLPPKLWGVTNGDSCSRYVRLR